MWIGVKRSCRSARPLQAFSSYACIMHAETAYPSALTPFSSVLNPGNRVLQKKSPREKRAVSASREPARIFATPAPTPSAEVREKKGSFTPTTGHQWGIPSRANSGH
jgi:hypothetical protein